MSQDLVVLALAVLGGGLVAGTAFFVFGRTIGRKLERGMVDATGRSAKDQAERVLAEAKRDAETARHEAVVAAKEEIIKARELWEQEAHRRRDEIDRHERRLEERELLIDRKLNALDDRDKDLDRKDKSFGERDTRLKAREQELTDLVGQHRAKLEQVAGLSAQQAKAEMMQALVDEAKAQAAATIRDIREEAKRNADRDAKKIVAIAIQRIAPEQTAETTVAAVALPNDEMKGRIIGREGRNIRAFETVTGVDVIIDDTPDTAIISCFDPVRREIGRLALEQLIQDGRIHPGRIEEVTKKVTAQVEQKIIEAGEQATFELGIHGMHAELVKLVGRMLYRTSYGQNIYYHSKEVAYLAGIMAAELKLDVHLAKRGGLLHDVGKVLTHQHEGTHVQLGVEMATKYGEHPTVINCIAAHHDDVPHESAISVLVQAADGSSGSRPGARREAFESYVKRLEKLEEIAKSYDGVERCFAIQAGREVRIAVIPEKIDDAKAQELSETIARRIESELQYPGQIRVVVVRETRAVGVAR
jgi:ribonuclease Y